MTPPATAAEALGVVDTHAHVCPPTMVRALATGEPGLAARFANLAVHERELSTGGTAQRLAAMDEAGIAVALLSAPPPAGAAGDDEEELCRWVDDELLELASAHPRRLRVLLSLPLEDPIAAVRHLQALGGHPLVAGVSVLARHRGRQLDDPAYEPLWRAVAEAGLPAQLHPAFEEPPAALRSWLLPTSLDAPFSTTTVTARLALSGLLDRVPDLTVVVPHLGGTLPYLAQRLVDQSGTGDARHDLLHYLRHRLVLDTCSFHPPALRCALETVGADRLVLGSDHPFRGSMTRAVEDVRAHLCAGDADAVLRGNAHRVFRISASTAL